jgi:hypothetical protein
MTEIWKSLKDIVECGDNYEVSNLGRVRSIDRKVNSISGGRTIKSKMIKFWYDKDGYARVTLHFKGSKKHYMVHRLVALSFIENPDNKPTVNHKDGDKINNNIDNLEWSTYKEQINHADDNNLRVMPNGENWYNAKLTEDKVREIFYLYKSGKYSQRKLAEIYGVSTGAIQGITYKKSWKHLNLE